MQDISGLHLDATWFAPYAHPCEQLRIDWGDGYVDETEHLLHWTVSRQLYDPQTGLPMLGQGSPATCDLTFDNGDGHFDPYLPYMMLYKRIILDAGYAWWNPDTNAWVPEMVRQFTGVIVNKTQARSQEARDVGVTCDDMSYFIRQYKRSSVVTAGSRPDELLRRLYPTYAHADMQLDQAFHVIPYAWLDGENLYNECLAMAGGDGGWFYFSKAGLPTFERVTHWGEGSNHLLSTISFDRSRLFGHTTEVTWKDVYTGVRVDYAPRYVGLRCVLYESQEQIEILAGAAKDLQLRFNQPGVTFVTPTKGQYSDADIQALTSGGQDITPALTITLVATGQTAILTIANGDTTTSAWIQRIRIRGIPILGDESRSLIYYVPQATREQYFGTDTPQDFKILQVANNPYMQTEAQAAFKGQFMRDWVSAPHGMRSFEAPACPYLELGDRLGLVNDQDDLEAGFLVQMTLSHGVDSLFEMQGTLLPAANLFTTSGSWSCFIVGGALAARWADTASLPIWY